MNTANEVEKFFKWPKGQAVVEARENRLPHTIQRGQYLFDLNRLFRAECWINQNDTPPTYKEVQK
jgi:hypothetical protein